MLVGNKENANYALVSAIQVEEGPRLFNPHFGFFYKPKNTRVKVIFVEKASGTQHVIMNVLENPLGNEIDREMEWKYFSKNLSDVSFLSTAWKGNSKLAWQVIVSWNKRVCPYQKLSKLKFISSNKFNDTFSELIHFRLSFS